MSPIINHVCNPFYNTDRPHFHLSPKEKITAVAIATLFGTVSAVLAGMPVLLLAGVPVFFAVTYYFKQRRITSFGKPRQGGLQPRDEWEEQQKLLAQEGNVLPSQSPKPARQKRYIDFKEARKRLFHKNLKADEVAELHTLEKDDLQAVTGPTRDKD